LPPEYIAGSVQLALAEDVGTGDLTADLVPADRKAHAVVIARHDLVVCGRAWFDEVFRQLDSTIVVEWRLGDGQEVSRGDTICAVHGPARAILTGERTALNFLQLLSGTATITKAFVDAVADTDAVILDTRKTLPGWRVLDKFAVVVGGGTNHRFGLYDGVLLKDNHIAAGGGLDAAVKAARSQAPAGLRVQVEVESAAQAEAACQAGADFLLLDNQTPEQVAEIVELIGDRALLEASGGIHLGNLRAYAEAGVRRVSLGALTHSAPCCDVALEIDETFAPRAPG
jgi:nicotinate-nucleotide pyrophosphorylase (carboxylating)